MRKMKRMKGYPFGTGVKGQGWRHIELGDTVGLRGEAYTYLEENKAIVTLEGEIVETPSFRYGRDWYFGDGVTVSYAGIQKDAMISKVIVSRYSDGNETIQAEFTVIE